jgi:hypothetical protein
VTLNPDQVKAKIAEMLLAEVRSDRPPRWFYVSVAGKEFYGAFVLRAMGPTDANRLLHALGFYPVGSDCETASWEVPTEAVIRIPESQRWRRLNREESADLGKPQ